MNTILIIEDDPTVLASVEDCLQDSGFATLGAKNGTLGLQMIQQHLPDLVLCDVQMPGMGGYEVLLNLRQSPLTATLPFIFLTAKETKSDFRYGMDLGADDYLTKPFSPQDLLRAIDSRLNHRAMMQSQAHQQLEHLRQSIALSLPHEFRTPITSLLTAADLLHDVPDDPEQVVMLANSIQSAAQRLYKLVQNFLLYTDLEISARAPDRTQPDEDDMTVDPQTLIALVATQVAANHGRSPDLHIQPSSQNHSAEIAFSESNLFKITDILIDNACKFSKPGTPIQIITSISPTHFSLHIRDQGRGMTPEQIANLGPYMQFERRRYEQQGLGLGLAIAQRLLDLNGGSLCIHSVPQEGTLVQVEIPRITRPASAPHLS